MNQLQQSEIIAVPERSGFITTAAAAIAVAGTVLKEGIAAFASVCADPANPDKIGSEI